MIIPSLLLLLQSSIVATVTGQVIPVSPGPNSLSAAIAIAKEGSTLVLEPGTYSESVVIPHGVSIQGKSADSTFLIGTGAVTITCEGDNRLSHFTIKGSQSTQRGVLASGPIRIERCRFDGVPVGVRTQGAFLSDIIFCDFVKCNTAVELNGSDSPTVWGCQFIEGVVAIDVRAGEPYIRNCAFWKNGFAIRRSGPGTRSGHGVTIRNNIFFDCKTLAIQFVTPVNPTDLPSIHHNIISGSGQFMSAQSRVVESVHHNVVDVTSSGVGRKHKTVDYLLTSNNGNIVATVRPALIDGVLKYVKPQPEYIDPDNIMYGPEESHLGVRSSGKPPPNRMADHCPIINSRLEEQQVLAHRRLIVEERDQVVVSGIHVDKVKCAHRGSTLDVFFNISRLVEEGSHGRAAGAEPRLPKVGK